MITLTIDNIPSLTLFRLLKGQDHFVFRSDVDVIQLSGATVTGQDRLSGNGVSYFMWSFETVVSLDELLLFDKIRKVQQTEITNNASTTLDNASTTLVLADYIYPVLSSDSQINSRSPLEIQPLTTDWGGDYYHIETPAFLRIPENHATHLAGDFWVLKFDAKELI